jgi:hypothetical protein
MIKHMLYIAFTLTPLYASAVPVNQVVGETIQKLLTRSQQAVTNGDERAIEINLDIKQLQPAKGPLGFDVESLIGSISIPLDDKLKIETSTKKNGLAADLLPEITVTPASYDSYVRLQVEKQKNLRATLDFFRRDGSHEFNSAVVISSDSHIANYQYMVLHKVELLFSTTNPKGNRLTYTGTCLLEVYIGANLQPLNCDISGELDLTTKNYSVSVNIEAPKTLSTCHSPQEVSRFATEIIKSYRKERLAFPSIHTLAPKVSFKTQVTEKNVRHSISGFYEGFLRPRNTRIGIIPGLFFESDDDTIVYVCANVDVKDENKSSVLIYFLKGELMDPQSSSLNPFAKPRAVLSPRNLSFRPNEIVTSTLSKIFSPVPIFNETFLRVHKAVSLVSDSLINEVINKAFEFGVDRLRITPTHMDIGYGARFFNTTSTPTFDRRIDFKE